jgi:hypothetical protein
MARQAQDELFAFFSSRRHLTIVNISFSCFDRGKKVENFIAIYEMIQVRVEGDFSLRAIIIIM